ncbi:hypothetical protein NBRC116602_22580 [Hyphomicrobiales bacterium 4NK60-0047b]
MKRCIDAGQFHVLSEVRYLVAGGKLRLEIAKQSMKQVSKNKNY